MRLRDRKASLAAIILAIAYIAALLTGMLLLAEFVGVHRLQPVSKFLETLLFVNAGFLMWRLLLKSYFVFKLYGLREALLSMPRTVVANLINILAAWRAIGHYIDQLAGLPVNWEKTRHFYPETGKIEQLRSRVSVGGRN